MLLTNPSINGLVVKKKITEETKRNLYLFKKRNEFLFNFLLLWKNP